MQPQGEFGGKLPPVRTDQLNWGWPWPGRGLASCPQFGSFDGRSQGGFEKPALGCIFIGPALVCLETCDPEMTTKETGPKAAFQSRRWVVGFIRPALVCLEAGNLGMTTKKTTPRQLKKAGRGLPFLNGRPWFAWRQATQDDDKRKFTPRRLQKAGVWLPFYKAGPGLPRDRQPGDGLEQPPCFNTTRNGNTPHSGSRPDETTSRSALRRRGRAARVMPTRR